MIVYVEKLAPRSYFFHDEKYKYICLTIGITHPNAKKLYHKLYPNIKPKEYIIITE